MRKTFLLFGMLLIAVVVLTPKVYTKVEESLFHKNHIVISSVIADMTILDKYAENGQYFLQFRIDSGYYIDKYNIKDNIRTYKLADHALFDQIDQNRAEDYAGITIEAMIDRRNISQEEARGIESDPFSIISRQEYSQYITVVNLSELKNDITDTTPNVVLAKVQGFKYRQRILPFTKPMSLLLKKCPTK